MNWDSPVDMLMLGPNLLKDLEQLSTKVEHNIKEVQECQKNYADKKIKDKHYQINEPIYLKLNH